MPLFIRTLQIFFYFILEPLKSFFFFFTAQLVGGNVRFHRSHPDLRWIKLRSNRINVQFIEATFWHVGKDLLI